MSITFHSYRQNDPQSYTVASEVPFGLHRVRLHTAKMVLNNDGDPFALIWLERRDGKSVVIGQIITTSPQIRTVNEFLRGLAPNMNIEFQSYSQYSQLMKDVTKECQGKTKRIRFKSTRHGVKVKFV